MNNYTELNLDEAVEKWASEMYASTEDDASTDVTLHVTKDYSKVHFNHGDPVFDGSTGPTAVSQTLYEEIFRNETSQQQMFSLQLTRGTVSVGRIHLTNALVADGKTRFRMSNLPHKVPVTAGFGSEINIQEIGSHEIKESLSWTVNTQVTVPHRKAVKAIVSIRENKYEGQFKINTTISGNMHCDVIDQQTGKYRSVDGNIKDVLEKCPKDTPGLNIANKDAKDVTPGQFYFVSEGNCLFKFGIEKEVSVENI